MARDLFGQRLDITDEDKAEARKRLRACLVGTREHVSPFDDAADVLDDWLGEFKAMAHAAQRPQARR